MWITITTTICATLVSLLSITLGYLLMAGSVGADANLVSFSLKAAGAFEINGWSFGPGLLMTLFGCATTAWTVHRTIRRG
ncbi:hypothetical protein [Achromobacter xylosoxidans]|uniref:hypothetical protein n=1 Tax=Alcaligenes xylosoxydans xylosoxydans TaxID=85698 RepID=UPI001041A092|nr:hypothetical protein [Achromobacter xylosoxidans]